MLLATALASCSAKREASRQLADAVARWKKVGDAGKQAESEYELAALLYLNVCEWQNAVAPVSTPVGVQGGVIHGPGN